MGYMRHHSIAVGSFKIEVLQELHERALEIFGPQVTPILTTPINGEAVFFIGPDGSKEGWSESEDGDRKRLFFCKIVESYKYEDGSNSMKYCEFYWRDDDREAEIVRHN